MRWDKANVQWALTIMLSTLSKQHPQRIIQSSRFQCMHWITTCSDAINHLGVFQQNWFQYKLGEGGGQRKSGKLTATPVKAVSTPEKNPPPLCWFTRPVLGATGIWSFPYFWKAARLWTMSLFCWMSSNRILMASGNNFSMASLWRTEKKNHKRDVLLYTLIMFKSQNKTVNILVMCKYSSTLETAKIGNDLHVHC